jgi:predicted DNA-binding protein
MLVETKARTGKMLSVRTDQEMFYALKALSDQTQVDSSTIMRLAVAKLIEKARTLPQPISWDDLKQIV